MIEFNYKEAMNQARELKEISDELLNIVNKNLRTQHYELGFAWKGEAADLFLKKADELSSDITKTAKATAAISTAVKVSAGAIKAAEDAAKRLAETVVR